MKALVLFYSYGGNTRRVAKLVQQETGADLCEIETVTPYTGSYNAVVDQGQREVNSGFEPELKPISADLSQYDTIILGTPVWWYTFAPAMRTLLAHQDFSGKVIYPFATNGGWLGHTFQDIGRYSALDQEDLVREESLAKYIAFISKKGLTVFSVSPFCVRFM